MQAASALLRQVHVTPDTCPLCGTSVGLLWNAERRPDDERLQARILTLRNRAEQLEHGDVSPRRLKDEVLWMCGPCRRIMSGLPRLDPREIQRRIQDEVRGLERGRRAS